MPERKTVGQLMEEMRLKAGAQNYHGHEYMDLERFADDTRHMIMENIQNKSALIPSDEIRSEELLAEQKFEAFITSLAHIIEKYGMRVLGEVDGAA